MKIGVEFTSHVALGKDSAMDSRVGNLLLEKLPEEYKSRLYSSMEPIPLPAGTMLYEPEVVPKYAHFMTSGMTSIVVSMENGAGVEVGMVGSEGVVEALHVLAPESARTVHTRALVQVAGTALRMPFADLRREFIEREPMRDALMAHVQRQILQLGQLAACNRLHEVEERLARWLLTVQDRVGSDLLPLTQELLSEMLGTRRSSVTVAASDLQRKGLIEYHRGLVRILDRPRLVEEACECYPIIRESYSSLLKLETTSKRGGFGAVSTHSLHPA